MIWEIGTVLKHLVLPPLGFGWLFVLAWLLMRRRPRAARWLLGIGVLSCYFIATPLAGGLLSGLVRPETVLVTAKPQAIVVLGAGRGLRFDTGDHVAWAYPSSSVLERLLTAAQLQKHTGLPVLVAGGSVDGRLPGEAAVMQQALTRDFGVPVRWVEDQSRNTAENARFSANMLKGTGVTTIILVTHEYHLRRARLLFEAQGIQVIPFAAQTGVPGDGLVPAAASPLSWRDWLPSAAGLDRAFILCNEIAGLAYSRFLIGAGAT